MNPNLIKCYLQGTEIDDMAMSILRRLPDEAFHPLIQIKSNVMNDGNADRATRQIQRLCRKYLSDDEELMRLIDEDEKEFPYND